MVSAASSSRPLHRKALSQHHPAPERAPPTQTRRRCVSCPATIHAAPAVAHQHVRYAAHVASRPKPTSPSSRPGAPSRRRPASGYARPRSAIAIASPASATTSKRQRLHSAPLSFAPSTTATPRAPLSRHASDPADEFAFPIFYSDPSLDVLLFDTSTYADTDADAEAHGDSPRLGLDSGHDSAPARSFSLDGRTRSPLARCIREILGSSRDREREDATTECRAVRAFRPVVENVASAYAVRVERWALPPPSPPIGASYSDGFLPPRRTASPTASSQTSGSPTIGSPASSHLRFAVQQHHHKSASEAAASPASPRRPGLLRKLSADALFGRPRINQRSQSTPAVVQATRGLIRPKSMLDRPVVQTAAVEKKRSFLSRTFTTAGRFREGRRSVFGIRVR